ncbi:bacillibactin-binding protein [Paenibacillus cellulosilyticus]|uniref:Bacillibactin-binding protein n=1 Tax=Paenibacillus cellulosilyticus TaxID=375489 RepID=A0A2V2YPR1_9BACL|nr:ABC transporter substrate-binding protein [Paenibacillus cellulosilyticus]PWV97344.1 bacillibactin-binding protein [Paenibacillus cellulosilyticus]QKS47458.1 ABC transporter substrate-binding protein [Paenibacillus cellulosilyticus]
MRNFRLFAGLLLVMAVLLAACGEKEETSTTGTETKSETTTETTAAQTDTSETKTDTAAAATKVVKYLDQEYTVPATAERIVITGALEAMEDSILMDIHPIGAISVGGQFPEMFSAITDKAESIGEKMEPNMEKILQLKPDVILASSKFDPAVIEQLSKITTTIPYSHIATNWESNLNLLGELTGKTDEAAKQIADYKSKLETVKSSLGDKLKDKNAVMVRIRAGEMYIYGPSLYYNQALYEDLGLTVPAEIQAAKSQAALPIEQLAEMNPDLLFIQFSPDENKDNPQALEDLKNNAIFKSLDAVKNGQLYENIVNPLAQGGTAYSKVEFLNAFESKLSQ